MAKDLTWEDAIQSVLASADGAIHYVEIAERIVLHSLRSKVGATPAATVASVIARSMRDADSPFQRVSKGEYTLKTKLNESSLPSVETQGEQIEAAETGALQAFGMFWRRELVVWGGKPRLLGRQGLGATEVNFAEQLGVYLLHDRERVIYVGRASDLLFTRLKAHTADRLGGRWDRFSWFGLRGVNPDGALSEPSSDWSQAVVIETLEALLIESLEPPLNRKRGDNFASVEYLQVADPEIEGRKKKQMLAELAKAAGLDA